MNNIDCSLRSDNSGKTEVEPVTRDAEDKFKERNSHSQSVKMSTKKSTSKKITNKGDYDITQGVTKVD